MKNRFFYDISNLHSNGDISFTIKDKLEVKEDYGACTAICKIKKDLKTLEINTLWLSTDIERQIKDEVKHFGLNSSKDSFNKKDIMSYVLQRISYFKIKKEN